MSDLNKFVPNTFIKNIAVGLPSSFKFINFPSGLDRKSNRHFIGRKMHINKFLSFLNSSTKGVYLVTGYRGMGKTSFVNHVLYNYRNSIQSKSKKSKVIPLHLTITQNAPKESDVLKQVVSSINDSFGSQKNRLFDILFASKYFFFYLFVLVFGYKLFFELTGIKKMPILFDKVDFSAIVFFLLPLIIIHCFEMFFKSRNKAFTRINNLMDRCFSEVTNEKNTSTQISFIKEFSWNFGSKKNKKYAVANTKEIEYELIQFLKAAKKEKYEFIFIFDELDKIDLATNFPNLNEDLEAFESRNNHHLTSNSLRNRKKAVLNIITGLKNFFTTAEARFIFIAGREMFDASLADISDKQSPLSSIFTFTFHIETLLKEVGNDTKNYFSLSVAIEDFLKQQIFDSKQDEEKSFDQIVKDTTKDDPENKKAVYSILQHFITYLIYRSSGSPKKMIHAFHEFVKPKSTILNDEQKNFIIKTNDTDSEYYLYFNSSEQYKISFINSIYRPFIIQYGKSYKSYSENSVISIPYFFDHLFKFHPFAFSMSNLELIPDLISVNKSINLRDDINHVVHYLLKSHIRNTDIELFDYKFHSKTANEIAYISKIFETEEAAFNFTLDESFPAKILLSDKIKEYRSIHSKYNTVPDGLNPQIFSIATLNSSLGDIYFFDQEFHDAISCYSDAIRAINNLRVDKINFRDFIGLIRNKLKLGLCFEKIYSFEEALSFYSDSIQDIKRFYKYYLKTGIYFNYSGQTDDIDKPFHTSSLNDILQICIQAFLANVYIQEKMGNEGITSSRVKAEMADFYRIIDFVAEHSGRNHMIIANSMLHQGKLLYYKNSSSFTFDFVNPIKNDFPKWDLNRGDYFNTITNKEKYGKRRQPYLALITYIIGLDEVMKSRKFFIDKVFTNRTTSDPNLFYSEKNDHLLYRIENKSIFNVVAFYNDLVSKFIIDNKEEQESFISNHTRSMASFLSSIGDCLLGLEDIVQRSRTTKRLRLSIFLPLKIITNEKKIEKCLNKSCIAQVIQCYLLSAKLYQNYGQISCALYEFQKIIQLLSHVLVIGKSKVNNSAREKIVQLLYNEIILPSLNLFYTSLGQSHIHILRKEHKPQSVSKKTISEEVNETLQKIVSLPNHQDIKETLIYFKKILVQIHYDTDLTYEITPTVSSQHLRVLELEFNSRLMHKKLQKNPLDQHSFIAYIFNQSSILRIFKIYGSNYIFGPSFNAHVHYRMAKIIDQYPTFASNPFLIERVNELIGGRSFSTLDAGYHYRMASDYYKIAIELHTAGQEYNHKMKEMVYLEDDFNDNRFHFGAAIERYYMMHDVFKKKIIEIEKKLKK